MTLERAIDSMSLACTRHHYMNVSRREALEKLGYVTSCIITRTFAALVDPKEMAVDVSTLLSVA